MCIIACIMVAGHNLLHHFKQCKRNITAFVHRLHRQHESSVWTTCMCILTSHLWSWGQTWAVLQQMTVSWHAAALCPPDMTPQQDLLCKARAHSTAFTKELTVNILNGSAWWVNAPKFKSSNETLTQYCLWIFLKLQKPKKFYIFPACLSFCISTLPISRHICTLQMVDLPKQEWNHISSCSHTSPIACAVTQKDALRVFLQVTSVQSSSTLPYPPVVWHGSNFSHRRGSHWKSWAWTQCHIPQCGAAAGAVQRLAEETGEGFVFQLVETVCHVCLFLNEERVPAKCGLTSVQLKTICNV